MKFAALALLLVTGCTSYLPTEQAAVTADTTSLLVYSGHGWTLYEWPQTGALNLVGSVSGALPLTCGNDWRAVRSSVAFLGRGSGPLALTYASSPVEATASAVPESAGWHVTASWTFRDTVTCSGFPTVRTSTGDADAVLTEEP